jgi:hypothetical protein
VARSTQDFQASSARYPAAHRKKLTYLRKASFALSQETKGMSLNAVLKAARVLGPKRMKEISFHYWTEAIVASAAISKEKTKQPSRTHILNWIAEERSLNRYLEIGVRNPNDNFNAIRCKDKTSVDPGVEYEANPVDYQMTSDEFYDFWRSNSSNLNKFELVFIDGLHRADQVYRDITHAIAMTEDYGVIVLHDCNPPHQSTAREDFTRSGVAGPIWNGTTWKAMCRYFYEGEFGSTIVDSDWGAGIIDKSKTHTPRPNPNPFYEFDEHLRMRHESGLVRSWELAMAWLRQHPAEGTSI